MYSNVNRKPNKYTDRQTDRQTNEHRSVSKKEIDRQKNRTSQRRERPSRPEGKGDPTTLTTAAGKGESPGIPPPKADEGYWTNTPETKLIEKRLEDESKNRQKDTN